MYNGQNGRRKFSQQMEQKNFVVFYTLVSWSTPFPEDEIYLRVLVPVQIGWSPKLEDYREEHNTKIPRLSSQSG